MINLIILDASGSMNSKVDEVKGGLKQLFSQIKKDYKEAKKKEKVQTIVTDFSSNGDFNVILNAKTVKELNDSAADNYSTRGMTALFDAIGKSFLLIDKDEKNVFVTILTDGGENDSKEFKHQDVKDIIQKAKDKGWAITFMGTNETDLANAESMGISKGNTFAFSNSKEGVKAGFNKMSSVRSMVYASYTTSSAGGQSASLDTNNLMEEDDKLNNKK